MLLQTGCYAASRYGFSWHSFLPAERFGDAKANFSGVVRCGAGWVALQALASTRNSIIYNIRCACMRVLPLQTYNIQISNINFYI